METFTNIFLKTTWLNDLFGALLKSMGIDLASPIGISIQYFLYDSVKIFILLSVLIFIVSYIQSYFTVERTRATLQHYKGVWANTLSALLGTITPFCSCSSIPIFIGFTKAGLDIGVTFSFLISSPMVDLASIAILMSFFNVKIALVYVTVGLLLAIIGGTLIAALKLEKEIEPFVYEGLNLETDEVKMTSRDRVDFSLTQVKDIVKKVWIYILIGVFIGALVHEWIPQSWILNVLGKDKWYSVLLATAIGVPLYADIFGTLPIAEALLLKGVGVGTVLAFMMAVTTLSLPSMILLKNVMKPKLLFIFIAYVTVGIIIVGTIINALQGYLI